MRERYGDHPNEAARKRLDHELGIINNMGFASYFLIVWDFVRFARENGIPSTARGSGCGAIVAYVLYLSHVCPLEYDLLFERFLDPNRSEAPDIDIDFCQDRRELVIDYVKQKYGEQSVAQIGTFGTLAAKAALKDVGRVLDVPLERVNFMCKLVPMKGAIAADLSEAMKSPDFRREYDADPQVRHMVDIALKLEGMNRNVGTHAAGVVIANGPITDYVPVQRVVRKADNEDGDDGDADIAVTTQWEMGILEKVGLLKMDFLGLRNLTVLDNCVKLIKKTRGIDIDLAKLPLDDKGVYQLLQRGDAKGVFQLESEGIRELLKRMKPDNIRDLIAVLALYRPGPLGGGMVDSYVNRKHGREKWDYPHPVLKDILDETYAVMVYQEQIMRILNRLGGIDLAKAYACIKAISKKNFEIINARKAEFVAGLRRARRGCEDRRRDLRADRLLRRVWLQQITHRGVRPDRLPDRVPQDTLHGRVHGRAALLRNRRRRQARHHGRSHLGCPEARDRGAPAGREPRHGRFRRAKQPHHLRSHRDQGTRPRCGRRYRPRAHRGRKIQRPLRLLRADRPAYRSEVGCREDGSWPVPSTPSANARHTSLPSTERIRPARNAPRTAAAGRRASSTCSRMRKVPWTAAPIRSRACPIFPNGPKGRS